MTSETEVKQEESPAEDSRVSPPGTGLAETAWRLTERLARWTGHQVMRPRARTFIVGVILILIAALFVGHSFWTAPLVIVGIVMIIVAWVGSRLEGRFAIEWSDTGAGFEMQARFKSPTVHPRQLETSVAPHADAQVPASVTSTTHPSAQRSTPDAPAATDATADDDGDVIEGEAHTMEIPAEELRALVAALEQVVPLAKRGDEPAVTQTISSNGSVATTQQGAKAR